MSTPKADGNAVSNGPWYFTATFWKRFSVFLSILLSAASLILSAFASLGKRSADTLKVLTVAGIIVNSISVTLSALTSLDWTTASTKEKKFLQQLENVTHIHHEGSRLVLVVKKEEEEED